MKSFVMAHGLSTVRNAPRILVSDAGRIVEAGTFDQLVAAGGRFASLARAQFIVTAPTGSQSSGAFAGYRLLKITHNIQCPALNFAGADLACWSLAE
jgi:hypothetical protein